MDFAEAGFVVGEIAEAESGGDEIEAVIAEGEAESVGFEKRKDAWRSIRGAARLRCTFFLSANEHGMRKIRAEDAGLPFPSEGKGQVTSAAAQIEHIGAGPLKNRAKEAGRAFAPQAIELKREEMIQQIIARRDFREHFADFARGVGFVCGIFRLSALNRDSGITAHFPPGRVFERHRLESVLLRR